jgi:hypothetical protein
VKKLKKGKITLRKLNFDYEFEKSNTSLDDHLDFSVFFKFKIFCNKGDKPKSCHGNFLLFKIKPNSEVLPITPIDINFKEENL